MLKLSSIVKRMRTKCPVFENRVAGTASFISVAKAGEAADIGTPYCFIIPLEEIDISPPNTAVIGHLTEMVRETFCTVVCVDNSIQGASPVGGVMKLSAMDQIADIKEQILSAFDDWVPNPRYDVIRFTRGRHTGMDGKFMWHQFDWTMQYRQEPGESESQFDEINDIIHGVSDDDGVPVHLKTIHVGIKPPDEELWVPDLTVPRFPLDPPIPEPTPEQLEAKNESEDCEYDVDPLPAWDVEGLEVGKLATPPNFPPFTPEQDAIDIVEDEMPHDPQWHGEEIDEKGT